MTNPNLNPGQVHLWRARLQAQVSEEAHRVLSAGERARAGRFLLLQHQARFVSAHFLLRKILSLYTGTAPELLQFTATPAGKPYLDSESAGPTLRFNLSHSGELMALAICLENEVGVDIEVHDVQLRWRDIATSYFSLGEIASIENAPGEAARLEEFYRAWTMKEAYLKAQGGGLAGSLEQVEVDLRDGAAPGFVRLPDDEQEKHHWEVVSFQPASGVSGAVVVESEGGPRPEMVCFSVENPDEISG